jgi:AraC-like DNA-binding protein
VNSFQLIDIILVIGIGQGIFLSLTLQRITNNNRSANSMLSLLLIIATIMLVGRFVYFRYLTKWVFQWSLFVDSLVFLFGPILYTYIRRLLFIGNTNFRLPKIHFLPFLAMVLFASYYVIFYTPDTYIQLFVDGNILFFFDIISLTMILFNALYLVKSFILLKSYNSKEKETFSFEQTPVTYLNFFLFSFSTCLIAWLASFINYTLLDQYFSYVNYESIWIAIPIFIYVIGYFSLKQPELFRIPLVQKEVEKKSRLAEVEIQLLMEKLDSLMLNERVYLQSNLTLTEVAELLHTSSNNISWLLNNVYHSTFYDFINKFRIKEFVHKIENKEHLQHTILALSMDVGFNSKSTFNKAFKLTMKETPSDYIKNLSAA